jgi:hypothetical protein
MEGGRTLPTVNVCCEKIRLRVRESSPASAVCMHPRNAALMKTPLWRWRLGEHRSLSLRSRPPSGASCRAPNVDLALLSELTTLVQLSTHLHLLVDRALCSQNVASQVSRAPRQVGRNARAHLSPPSLLWPDSESAVEEYTQCSSYVYLPIYLPSL